MRPLAISISVAIGICAISVTIWLGRYSPLAPPLEKPHFPWQPGTAENQMALRAQSKAAQKALDEHKAELKRLEENRPEIATQPPFPKARTGERVHNFGSMRAHEEKKHKFLVENKGQGPLVIAKGPTNCTCTISNIPQGTIPPGQSAEVEISWTPKETTPTFAKSATVWTNDPDLPEIEFKILGRVVQPFQVEPERDWHAGHVTDIQDGVAQGTVTSAVDPDFKITSVEMPDKNVTVKYRPLTAAERMRESLKAGYYFAVTVGRGIPAGHYRREMRIHSTLEGNKTISVEVTALRSGPILFLSPIGNSRAYWNAEKSVINLGRFPHEAGTKVILPALVYGSKEKFAISGVEKDADFVKVSVVPNPEISSGEQQGVRFVFEVPPGAPPVTRVAPHGVHLNLKTNHPKLRDLSFQLELVSQ